MRSILAVIAIAAVASAHANLLVNGGFESPSVPAGTFIHYGTGSTGMTGWTVVGPQVSQIHTTYGEPGLGVTAFNANSGLASLDITGGGNVGTNAGVTQTVATVAGQLYELSFFVGKATGGANYSSQSILDVSIDGGARVSYFNAVNTPVGFVNWIQHSVQFTATSTSTSITFFNGTALGTNNFVGLDDASLTAVPEPMTCGLLAIGAAAALRRRRRHSR